MKRYIHYVAGNKFEKVQQWHNWNCCNNMRMRIMEVSNIYIQFHRVFNIVAPISVKMRKTLIFYFQNPTVFFLNIFNKLFFKIWTIHIFNPVFYFHWKWKQKMGKPNYPLNCSVCDLFVPFFLQHYMESNEKYYKMAHRY